MRKLALVTLGVIALPCVALAGEFIEGSGMFGAADLKQGQVVSLTIPSTIQSSSNGSFISDLPVSMWRDGYTGVLRIYQFAAGLTNNTSSYNCLTNEPTASYLVPEGCPSHAAPSISFSMIRPGFNSSGAPITFTDSGYAVDTWERGAATSSTMPFSAASASVASYMLPIETTFGSDAEISLGFNKTVFKSDKPGRGTMVNSGGSPFYTGSGMNTLPTGSFNIINNSPDIYPQPVCNWITDDFKWIPGNQPLTIEVVCDYELSSMASVTISMNDGTHSAISYTTSTPLLSKRMVSQQCTSSDQSNILHCSSVLGLQVGSRVQVSTRNGTGNVPGSPIIGQIDTTNTTNCPAGATTPCVELFDTETLTPNAKGVVTVGLAGLNHGSFIFDGLYAGSSDIVDSGSDFGSTPVHLTPPAGWTGAFSSVTGGSATLTISGSGTGFFTIGQWVTWPGMPTSTSVYIKTFGTGTGGAGTYTVGYNTNGSAVPPAGSGLTIGVVSAIGPLYNTQAAQSASAGQYMNGANVTTDAACGVSSTCGTTAEAMQIRQKLVAPGCSGCTVTIAVEFLPVYAVTFTTGDQGHFGTTSEGVWFELLACPKVGDRCLDSQGGNTFSQTGVQPISGNGALPYAPMVGMCSGADYFWDNPGTVNSGVCNSTNGAWLPTNGQVVTPALKNLSAYFDPQGLRSPRYVFVDPAGTYDSTPCTTNCNPYIYDAGYLTSHFAGNYPVAADFGATPVHQQAHAFATLGAASAFVKNCNQNSNTAGNCSVNAVRPTTYADAGAIIYVYLSNTPVAGATMPWGVPQACSTSTYLTGLTVTSGEPGGAPIGYYDWKPNPNNVTISNGLDYPISCQNVRINNLRLVAAAGNILGGQDLAQGTSADSIGFSVFNKYYVVFDNDYANISGSASDATIKFGMQRWVNSIIDQSQAVSHVLSAGANSGSADASEAIGNTVYAGGYPASPQNNLESFLLVGNHVIGGTTITATAGSNQRGVLETSTISMYNHLMVQTNSPSIYINSIAAQGENVALAMNIYEAVNGQQGIESISNDGYWGWIDNVFRHNELALGVKTNVDYSVSYIASLAGTQTTGGSLQGAATATASTLSSGTETITVPGTWQVGMTIATTGFTPSTYNCATCTISAVGSGTVTFTNGSATATSTVQGVVTPSYFVQNMMALWGQPTTITSAQPIQTLTLTAGKSATSINYLCEGDYVIYTLLDITNPPTHYALYSGSVDGKTNVDANQVKSCQTITLSGVSADVGPSLAAGFSVPEFSPHKYNVREYGDVDLGHTIEADVANTVYGSHNGGRVDNFPHYYRPDDRGDLTIVGAGDGGNWGVLLGGSGGQGQVKCEGCYTNYQFSGQIYEFASSLAVKNYRGWVGLNNTQPLSVQPALNIGGSNFCPTFSPAFVPAGYEFEPWDLNGNPWANNGTDLPGPYASGSCK